MILSTRPMLCLVRPGYPSYLHDKLFERTHEFSLTMADPFVKWAEHFRSVGIAIHTWDMRPLEDASVIIFHDLPIALDEVRETRRRAPRAKLILHLIETPLKAAYVFEPINHQLFDAIITYNWRLVDEKRYFYCSRTAGCRPALPQAPSFEERRLLSIVNSNKTAGVWKDFDRSPNSWPLLGDFIMGYRVSIRQALTFHRGQTMSRMRRIARLAEEKYPGILDIYGPGWRGTRYSWIHRLVRPRPYKAVIAERVPKFDVLPRYRFNLTFENYEGDVGFFDEKIFDALYAETVPIYLGDIRIKNHIPEECFISLRKFSRDSELLEFVRDCGKDEWTRYWLNGKAFVSSESIKVYQPQAFAERMLQIVREVLK